MTDRPILRVTMLGSFELHYDLKPVRLKKRQNSKPVQLLQMLLYNRKTGIPRQRVIEALYGQQAEIDTTNNLNATVSQLRRLLRDSALPRENYICADIDRYRFQSAFPVQTDTEKVLDLRQKASAAGGKERIELLYELCSLYRGRFLPDLDGESWVEAARSYYQGIYQESMEELCRMLWEERRYQTIQRLTDHAAKLFPFEEWQAWQYKSLLAQGRMREAQDLYRRVEKLYLSELDAPPPERMRQRIRASVEAPQGEARNVQKIRDQLDEAAPEGPYCLAFPSFLDAYQLINRMSGAVGQPVCLMLCTLRGGGSRSRLDQELFCDAMERLELALCRALRQEDTFTRYSRSQYLVILTGVEEMGCGAISQRITGQFRCDRDHVLECQAVSAKYIQTSSVGGYL